MKDNKNLEELHISINDLDEIGEKKLEDMLIEYPTLINFVLKRGSIKDGKTKNVQKNVDPKNKQSSVSVNDHINSQVKGSPTNKPAKANPESPATKIPESPAKESHEIKFPANDTKGANSIKP